MFRSKPVRFLLGLILVGGVSSIAVSLWLRSGRTLDGSPTDRLLAPDISRLSTEFEYEQLKEGRTAFRVKAGTSTLTKAGEQLLETVQLVRFHETGEPADSVTGSQALYKIAEKQIEFSGNVVIELSEGPRIVTQRTQADLGQEIVTIPEGFRFVHDKLEGSGSGLVYAIASRALKIHDGFRLILQGDEGATRAIAGAASYPLDTARVLLEKGALMEMGQNRVKAGSIEIELDAERRLRSLIALDSASLSVNNAHAFAGNRIDIRFPEVDGQSRGTLDVFGGPASSGENGPQRARYQEIAASGVREVRATLIHADFRRGLASGNDHLRFQNLEGVGEVSVRSKGATLVEGSGDLLQAAFQEQTEVLNRMVLNGTVVLDRWPAGGKDGVAGESLRCARLEIFLDGSSRPRTINAVGPARLELRSDPVTRRLSAGQKLQADYSDGTLSRVAASGGCSLESVQGSQTDRLTADGLKLAMAGDVPKRFAAEGNVRIEGRDEAGDYRVQGHSVVLEYAKGLPSRGEANGDVLIRRVDAAGGVLELAGERAIYSVPARRLKVESGGRANLVVKADGEELKANARQFELGLDDGALEANGAVEAVVPSEAGPSVVTAERMKTEGPSSLVRFEGNPSLVQGSNSVSSAVLTIDRDSRALVAEGAVDSLWVDATGETPTRKIRIRSRHLELDGASAKGFYSGDVHFSSEELDLRAPRLDLFFLNGSKSELDYLEASGGVQIKEKGRNWVAEKAVYYRKTDQVRVGK